MTARSILAALVFVGLSLAPLLAAAWEKLGYPPTRKEKPTSPPRFAGVKPMSLISG